jgi:hypothetical protein
MSATLEILAKDLTTGFPRSPREVLGGYVLVARILDKCRAKLNGTNGEYTFGPGIDEYFWRFTGIESDAFEKFVATGADDDAVAQWIRQHSKVQERIDIVKWNNQLRYARLNELPDPTQAALDEYIQKHVPKHRPVYVAFDIYDLEEGRL